MTTQGQSQRILSALLPGAEISAVDLHRIGSGKPLGWCASLSRRISDLRDMGYDIKCRKETAEGQTHTFYKLIPKVAVNNSVACSMMATFSKQGIL